MLCGKAGFEPRTLGTKAEGYDHCATRQVNFGYDKISANTCTSTQFDFKYLNENVGIGIVGQSQNLLLWNNIFK
jgi:hypothetical protein